MRHYKRVWSDAEMFSGACGVVHRSFCFLVFLTNFCAYSLETSLTQREMLPFLYACALEGVCADSSVSRRRSKTDNHLYRLQCFACSAYMVATSRSKREMTAEGVENTNRTRRKRSWRGRLSLLWRQTPYAQEYLHRNCVWMAVNCRHHGRIQSRVWHRGWVKDFTCWSYLFLPTERMHTSSHLSPSNAARPSHNIPSPSLTSCLPPPTSSMLNPSSGPKSGRWERESLYSSGREPNTTDKLWACTRAPQSKLSRNHWAI